MVIIDMKRIREALPKRAIVKLRHKTKPPTSVFIECIVSPGLYVEGTKEEEQTLKEVFDWQRAIIGKENISEFYTLETGRHWHIYLKRVPMEFINTTSEDIKSYVGINISDLKK